MCIACRQDTACYDLVSNRNRFLLADLHSPIPDVSSFESLLTALTRCPTVSELRARGGWDGAPQGHDIA